MNINKSGFHNQLSYWNLATPFVHLAGLVLVWKNPQNIIYWSSMSVVLYGFLLKIMTNSMPSLPWIIGYANWISLFRLFLVHVLFILNSGIHHLILLLGFIGIMILDGVDGSIARKYDQETEEGAALDNETDALMTLFLTWIHVSNQRIPEWILIPGGLRYIYVWIIHFLPTTNTKELLPRKLRATISIIFFISLLFPFVFQTPEVSIIISIAGTFIIVSFLLGVLLRILSISNKQ